jgi:hypothetical protein
VTETSSREQASVVFMGRGSFRMQAVGAPGLNELAIPNRASDIPTERIFRVKGDDAFLALPLRAPAVVQPWRAASKGALIGLGGVMFALGMLVTSPAAHSWLRVGRRPVQVVATPVAPVAVAPIAVAPVTAPVAVAPVTAPIVVAVAAPEPAAAPAPVRLKAVALKLAGAPRARVVRPTRAKHPAEAATGGPLPEARSRPRSGSIRSPTDGRFARSSQMTPKRIMASQSLTDSLATRWRASPKERVTLFSSDGTRTNGIRSR